MCKQLHATWDVKLFTNAKECTLALGLENLLEGPFSGLITYYRFTVNFGKLIANALTQTINCTNIRYDGINSYGPKPWLAGHLTRQEQVHRHQKMKKENNLE
jgi:hypothetical protein